MAEFASKGWASLNTVLGSIGTAGATNILGGLFSGNRNCGEDGVVSRHELNLENKISEKDMEIAYLRGQNATDIKILELYKYIDSKIEGVNATLATQAVYNATQTATISCMQGQIAQLQSLTKCVIPIASICPTPAVATTTAG